MNAPGSELPLRDIHLPPEIGWWPIAPGWWVLAVTILLGVLLSIWWWKRPSRRKPLQAARAALTSLDAEFQVHQDSQRLAQGLSTLLRRTAISLFPREQVAGLTGDAWLMWLDDVAGLSPDEGFQNGPGRTLRDAQYRADTDAQNGLALLALANTWLTRVNKGGRRRA
ncbi:MAG: DUF4381 domain-containing protein [Gammaproteobacteria bacterium]|nr:DUF4381 domain-containing protein [Gammaproteobacteria bacterium]MCP5137779.1 DUF4381 domain-containing protein [Gammaproteobacteria bacterium]